MNDKRTIDLAQMRAVAQVQRWRDFSAHLGAYIGINLILLLIWALMGGGEFWPGVSLAAWGLGLSSQHFLNSFSPMTIEAAARELQRHRIHPTETERGGHARPRRRSRGDPGS